MAQEAGSSPHDVAVVILKTPSYGVTMRMQILRSYAQGARVPQDKIPKLIEIIEALLATTYGIPHPEFSSTAHFALFKLREQLAAC